MNKPTYLHAPQTPPPSAIDNYKEGGVEAAPAHLHQCTSHSTPAPKLNPLKSTLRPHLKVLTPTCTHALSMLNQGSVSTVTLGGGSWLERTGRSRPAGSVCVLRVGHES